jgi:hypothetical protein
MTVKMVKRIGITVVFGSVALLAVACGRPLAANDPPSNAPVTTRPLPALVDGVPLLALASKR